jgi:hypothetical protein
MVADMFQPGCEDLQPTQLRLQEALFELMSMAIKSSEELMPSGSFGVSDKRDQEPSQDLSSGESVILGILYSTLNSTDKNGSNAQ